MKRALSLVLAAACGGGGAQVVPPGGDGSYVREPYPMLSQYGVVEVAGNEVVPREGVIPYDLNTPLYSDGALKRRALFLPRGTQATYDAAGAFQFPEGALLIKSFGFRDDLRKPAPAVDWIETRLLIRTADGWTARAYVWDAAHKDAAMQPGGEVRDVSWIDAQGATLGAHYLVPSAAQCQQCHSSDGVLLPLGPKARHLNRDFAYPGGIENQLAHWARVGALAGAPADPAQAPRFPVWNDPATGSVEQRARAYLEVNCAHCHSAGGSARTTGLFLSADVTDPSTYGVCKPPVAAGAGSGGFGSDVVPGDPDHSIMTFRLTATSPSIAMPLIGRSVVDADGLALVRQWIAGLPGKCP